jgi:hypothetical protein
MAHGDFHPTCSGEGHSTWRVGKKRKWGGLAKFRGDACNINDISNNNILAINNVCTMHTRAHTRTHTHIHVHVCINMFR